MPAWNTEILHQVGLVAETILPGIRACRIVEPVDAVAQRIHDNRLQTLELRSHSRSSGLLDLVIHLHPCIRKCPHGFRYRHGSVVEFHRRDLGVCHLGDVIF